MRFSLTPEQEAKIYAWETEQNKPYLDEHGYPYFGTIGGNLTYMFTPTSLGVIEKVKHASGEILDITDYSSW